MTTEQQTHIKSYKCITVNGKQVRLHRHLMQIFIGRELTYNEVVHHINGDIWDNRLENLEVVDRRDHPKIHFSGQIRRRNGRYVKCIDCGLTRYYCPKTVARLSLHGDNYRCRKCYDNAR